MDDDMDITNQEAGQDSVGDSRIDQDAASQSPVENKQEGKEAGDKKTSTPIVRRLA